MSRPSNLLTYLLTYLRSDRWLFSSPRGAAAFLETLVGKRAVLTGDDGTQWADNHADSKQLRLQDQLSIPWQRLMRYRLLLKGIIRLTEKPVNYDTDRRTTTVNQKSSMKLMVLCIYTPANK